jgi:cell division protein FtsW (lipid II flippase)
MRVNLGDLFVLWAMIFTMWYTTGQSWWLFTLYMVIGLLLNVAVLYVWHHKHTKGGF